MKRQIKNFIIYPRFQFALLFANILVSAITLVLIYYKVNEVFEKLRQMGEKINLEATHPYFNFIMHSQKIMNLNLSWAFGLSIFLTAVFTIYLSHKIAGPLYNLKNYFLNIVNDKPQAEMKFRKDDFYNELPLIINQAIVKLRQK